MIFVARKREARETTTRGGLIVLQKRSRVYCFRTAPQSLVFIWVLPEVCLGDPRIYLCKSSDKAAIN